MKTKLPKKDFHAEVVEDIQVLPVKISEETLKKLSGENTDKK